MRITPEHTSHSQPATYRAESRRPYWGARSWIATTAFIYLVLAPAAFAQNLNWEGQTGAFVTPFAYTSASTAHGFGLPSVSFHYLDGGEVIGGNYQISATVGFFQKFEAGYTRSLNSAGSTPSLSPLFEGGFNTFHAKATLVSENSGKKNYIPAIAVGFVARTQVRRVGGVITGCDTTNGDVFLVATKTITQTKAVPILINAGIKGTNASVLGIAGNADAWQARGFGAVGFVLPGPAKSKIVVGSEVAQEPRHIQNLPGATLPTTLTYFARVIPTKRPFNVDFGIAQAAGEIMPGANIKARAQFATGVSYRF